MGKSEYDIVMSEIENIAEKVNAFPRHLQESVYRHLVDTLLDRHEIGGLPNSARRRSGASRDRSLFALRNSSIEIDRSELRSYYTKHSLGKTNDMEYAAFCAYFVTELASPEAKRSSIDENVLTEMCEIAGRESPGNARSTLNNARRVRKYLDASAPGRYVLSDTGREFVKKLLKKESAK